MGHMQNKRIAIAGSRKMEEMKLMVAKKGGTPLERPLQETVKCTAEEMKKAIEAVIERGTDWAVFTTGIGTAAVFEAAEQLGLAEPFRKELAATNVATRGYKTVQELKKHGIAAAANGEDGTNAGLLEAFSEADLKGKRVFVQLHGERVPLLEEGFSGKGADLTYIMPYETTVPDPELVATLVGEVIAGDVDAVLFTATPQVRVLFQEAKKQSRSAELAAAFNEKALAASVGKVTTGTLHEYGVTRVVAPEHERMGALVVAVDEYFKAD